MKLDFRHCKTKEDVEKVFKKHKKEFEVLRNFKRAVAPDGVNTPK